MCTEMISGFYREVLLLFLNSLLLCFAAFSLTHSPTERNSKLGASPDVVTGKDVCKELFGVNLSLLGERIGLNSRKGQRKRIHSAYVED